MSFDARIHAFAARFLSGRVFELIVEPALADAQFEQTTGRASVARCRVAVVRAVLGGFCADLRRGSRDFLALTLMPVCYYLSLVIICFDFFSFPIPIARGLFAAAVLVLVFALGPVMVCFWPERRPAE